MAEYLISNFDTPDNSVDQMGSECLHCGEACPDGREYCCEGCHSAQVILKNEPYETSLSQFSEALEDGSFKVTLSISGVHCASCIQAIEKKLLSQRHIQSARVNMSTERLSFTWRGEQHLGDTSCRQIEAMGYALRPLDQVALSGVKSEEEKLLFKAIAASGFAAGNIMLLSVGLWTSSSDIMGLAVRDFLHWVSALIALPAVAYAGQPFFKSAWSVLKEGYTNMDVPISLAIILASCMSIFETINHGEHVYFDSAVMLLFFLLIGRYLDARARGKARESAANLLSKLVGQARIKVGNSFDMIPLDQVMPEMIVYVNVGENIPTDGTILNGTSDIDMSLITGESLPVSSQKGDRVYAGTTNLSSSLEIQVSSKKEQSLLNTIVSMMETAEQGNARFVRLADRAARFYTPAVHSLALGTFLFWVLFTTIPWQVALLHSVTVLIITCPCALGLAVPVVQVLASSLLMRHGILPKSGDALEKLAEIDTVIFDKTGTLTKGILTLPSPSHPQEIMQLAASMAAQSSHPLSRALAAQYDGELLPLTVQEKVGSGLQAEWEGKHYQLGSRRWLHISSDSDSEGAELWLKGPGLDPYRFVFQDELKTDSAELITFLQKTGLTVHLLSGDRSSEVLTVAEKVGIRSWYADMKPSDKTQFVENLQQEGHKVLFVGDGLNDAPALAAAHVSMSPSTAIDISQNAADIVFQGVILSPLKTAWLTSKLSARLIKQNFGLAILYNMIAVPFAILGYVTPMIAAIAMSSSSLVVISNSFRLRLVRAIQANR
ncbi:copper-translocating P-type ATPase [Temperatibacter marinus]|uniref:Copper-translocating P-type ATPase n=1 Tax=Temperatibacter marinus TaxID=1456591 RepID=A0AA52EJG6_9PROT|nr:copper-translocating P-type ATPase [Temperatibacter marinus]WND03404.1 copper-translocating P-type ATPase [Temperatibacter marinus]